MQRTKLLLAGLCFSLSLMPLVAMAQVSEDDSLLGAPAAVSKPAVTEQSPVLAPIPPQEAPAATAAPGGTTAESDAPLPDNPTAEDDAQADAAYSMIFKKLSEKHQAQMKALDDSFVTTLHPAMQVFRMGAELEYCLQPPRLLVGQDQKYIAAFKNFRDQRDDEQDALWAAHRKETLKITFLDHDLLDAHYRNQAALAMSAGRVLMQDEKAKEKLLGNTDCAAMQKVLDSAAAKADAKGKKRPALPAPQGTQTPAQQ
ncbi:MAG: hypothetical protein PW788_01500 [Micavibrio sp.]|nr:hypothetical protein [Micavibrio sp.]